MTAPSARLRASFTTLTAVLFGLLLLSAPAAQAATFTVDDMSDAMDVNPGNGFCVAGFGGCTLRAAIQEANALAGADTITLPAGTYTLAITGQNENAAATGDLDITESLTINGAGSGVTIIDGAALDRVFDIFSAPTVTLSGVTIQNGNLPTGQQGGGGIRNRGTTSLTDVIVQNNTVNGVDSFDIGGGIFNQQGTLTLNNVTITGNSADRGGGIFNAGSSTLTVTNSTISSNTARAGGGVNAFGTAAISNTTISGNTGTSNAGGISANTGDTTLTNVTISANSSPAGGGGGIYHISGSGTISLRNTIVANSPSGGNCRFGGTYTSLGYNLDSANTCAFAGTGDLVNTNPLLGPLALNAPGATQTHALLAGSPAIDAADPVTFPATDQRGVARPQGARADIGAYEAAPPPPPAAIAPIPTLSEWALIGLAGLLGLWGMMRLRRV